MSVLKRVRLVLAILAILAAMLLFVDVSGAAHLWLGWIAKIQLLPAILALNLGVVVLLVILTLLFGRVYCSVICPLGIFQDVMARFGKMSRKNRYSYSPERKVLRYTFFVLFIATLVGGVSSVAGILEPYSSFGRIASNLFAPVYAWGNNLLAYISERAGSYAFYPREVWVKGIGTFVVAVSTLVVLAVLTWFKESRRADELVKARMELIEGELPRFVATIHQELAASRDVLRILENYKKHAGPDFARELDVLTADIHPPQTVESMARTGAGISTKRLPPSRWSIRP